MEIEKDCSPLWSLFQQIITDMKNGTPMWEEFISKATKLHSALKSALVAVAAFLDAFQKIADAATNARGATKEIGTALTRMCLRHRAIETRMKTFIGTLSESLVGPLSERAEEWRRGACSPPAALGREYTRECKRARAELRRRAHEAARHAKKARRPGQPDAQRRADVCLQDVQERRQQLEEMEEKAVKAALIEERSRFCQFVSLLNPVVECEVAMLAEVGHLQEGSEQLLRHVNEPRTLPAASLQVICDVKAASAGWSGADSAPHSPTPSSRLGSRKSSLCSISSLDSGSSERRLQPGSASKSNVSCSTPLSNASSNGTLPAHHSNNSQDGNGARVRSVCSSDSGFRSTDGLHLSAARFFKRAAYPGSDNQSVSSACTTPAGEDPDMTDDGGRKETLGNTASATWPDLKDTAQFERAASAIMGGRPHTISAGYEKAHGRPALGAHTFHEAEGPSSQPVSPSHSVTREAIYARPPLPTRCSSLERPSVPAKSYPGGQHEFKTAKPSSLPPHLTKEITQALYVNMSELATLAAGRAQQQQQQIQQQQIQQQQIQQQQLQQQQIQQQQIQQQQLQQQQIQQQQIQQQQVQQQQIQQHQTQTQQNNSEHPQQQQEKVCSESSASESSLESSSGYGSQGAFAADDAAHPHLQHHQMPDADSEMVTLRRDSDPIAAARESFSISLGSLEEAVRSLDEVNDSPTFATINKSKPSVPKKRPLSMTATCGRAGVASRRGSTASVSGKPPPPVRRSSSITRQYPNYYSHYQEGNMAASQQGSIDNADNLPPPPAFLLQPDGDSQQNASGINVAETVKQLTEIKHMPASPSLMRRSLQQIHQSGASSPPQPQLSTFQQSKGSLSQPPNLNPIYGQTGHRIMTYEQNSMYARKNSVSSPNSETFTGNANIYGDSSPNRSSDNTMQYCRENNYGQAGYKLQQDKKYGNSIYAQPSQIIAGFNSMALTRGNESLSPLAMRKSIAARSQSAERRGSEQGGLIASLSAKLAPQLSPRTNRRAVNAVAGHDSSNKSKSVEPAFLNKLSATLQHQRRQLDSQRACTVRHMMNTQAQPDPRICHGSLMEQIKRGATLKRNKQCNDRSAPNIG